LARESRSVDSGRLSHRRSGLRRAERAPNRGAGPGYHDRIKGVDSRGRRYHALNPDTYYWAHSTFFMSTILIADNFMGGITEAQKRRLFEEHVQ
jgi:uncharacterized protein (DUF2236 family)